MEDEAKQEWENLKEELKNAYFLKALRELARLQDNPQFQVLIACGLVESIADRLFKEKCKHGGKLASLTLYNKIIVMHELGLIDDLGYKLLDKLRGLRNKAAHQAIYEVDIDAFRGEVQTIYSQHGQTTRIQGGKHMSGICIAILGELWNRHNELLSSLFIYGPDSDSGRVFEKGR